MTKSLKNVYRPHARVHPPTGEKSRTMQEFREESNINIIMAKYEKTKMIDHLNENQGHYGDFISYDDYHSSLNKIYAAQATFDSLPAQMRFKFNNDPAQFLNFVQDEKNYDEMVEMGLANARPPAPKEQIPQTSSPTEPKKNASETPSDTA